MEIYTALKPEEDWTTGRSMKQLQEAMEETLEEAVPNVVAGYTQTIQMRVEELISGVRATLALKLYGEDLAELDRIRGELKNVLATVPGVADLSLEANLGTPQIRIKVDHADMARHGITDEPLITLVSNGHGGTLGQVLPHGL